MALEDVQARRDALAAFEAGGVPLFKLNKANPQEVDELIQAAAEIANGRNRGLSDDQTLQRLAQNVLSQASKQDLMTPERVNALLKAEGLEMDERDIKSNISIAREEGENYGYSDEEDYRYANQREDGPSPMDQKRKALATIRRQKRARGGSETKGQAKFRAEREEELLKAQETAKNRDFGILRDRAENAQDLPAWVTNTERGEPELIQGSVVQNRLTPAEARQLRYQDRAEGMVAAAEAKRRARGDLSPIEQEKLARSIAENQYSPELAIDSAPRNFDRRYENDPVRRYDAVAPKYGGPAPRVTPDEAQSAILSQLRARKAAADAGVPEERQRQNAIEYIDKNVMPGVSETRATYLGPQGDYVDGVQPHGFTTRSIFGPDVTGLGKALGVGADMGVTYGTQRPTESAVRVGDGNGSAYYVDPATGNLAGGVQWGPEQKFADSATNLNAPHQQLTARGFIAQNVYDNYGAAFYGDESIIGQLNEKGSGGGIPQVDITGELSGFSGQLQKKLGLETAPRIRGADDLDAAVAQYIAAQKPGKKFYRMEDGKQVFSEAPGIEEVFYDMKIQPAEQKALANALYQLEMAKRQGVDLDRKQAYFEGGRFAPLNFNELAMEKVIFGVNDPARGGDRLEILKGDAKEQAAFRKSEDPDAAKPFIARTPEMPKYDIHQRVYRGIPADKVRAGMERMYKGNKKRDPVKEEKNIRAAIAGNKRVAERYRLQKLIEDKAQVNYMGRIIPKSEVPGAKIDRTDTPLREGLNIVSGNQAVREFGADMSKVSVPPGYTGAQPITQAQTPASVAPQPGDTTGNKIGAFIDAGIGRAREFATSPNYQRGRRIGYGVAGGGAALAGLAALISGEREEREQEAYR